eukprot:TRINITY_DN35584_c0_g1_i1.p1 TRINITY_DN35584_c0_g1~~TRINITY_DN35584_c0_g1_i1.p1  ORF type:complete len:388 (+),score=60.37 TRINITY_DN35584_c0_g1_i1:134-1297(+)
MAVALRVAGLRHLCPLQVQNVISRDTMSALHLFPPRNRMTALFPILGAQTRHLSEARLVNDSAKTCKSGSRTCDGATTFRRLSVSARAGEDKAAPPDSPTLGFLGLGIMGTAMAKNLIGAGYSVTVWNRSMDKCQALVDAGALQGSTPQKVTEACDITFAMLADPDAALEVACGASGAVKGLGPGKGYVDVSTVDAATAQAIARAVKEAGAQFLEAPVSGSKKPAENGTLIFLTAGDEELFTRASPALDVMGKSKFFLGEVGKGAQMKLVVNMMLGSLMASFSEALALGEKVGLDPTTIVEVVGQGAVAAPMFSMKAPGMLKGSFAPAFPLKHQQKDLRLVLALAQEMGLTLPVAAATNEEYLQAQKMGLGDQDFSAVFQAIRESKS